MGSDQVVVDPFEKAAPLKSGGTLFFDQCIVGIEGGHGVGGALVSQE